MAGNVGTPGRSCLIARRQAEFRREITGSDTEARQGLKCYATLGPLDAREAPGGGVPQVRSRSFLTLAPSVASRH